MLHQFLRARRPDEAVDVDVDEGGHEELAVEPVHDAAVPGNDVAKILNQMQHVQSASIAWSQGLVNLYYCGSSPVWWVSQGWEKGSKKHGCFVKMSLIVCCFISDRPTDHRFVICGKGSNASTPSIVFGHTTAAVQPGKKKAARGTSKKAFYHTLIPSFWHTLYAGFDLWSKSVLQINSVQW